MIFDYLNCMLVLLNLGFTVQLFTGDFKKTQNVLQLLLHIEKSSVAVCLRILKLLLFWVLTTRKCAKISSARPKANPSSKFELFTNSSDSIYHSLDSIYCFSCFCKQCSQKKHSHSSLLKQSASISAFWFRLTIFLNSVESFSVTFSFSTFFYTK